MEVILRTKSRCTLSFPSPQCRKTHLWETFVFGLHVKPCQLLPIKASGQNPPPLTKIRAFYRALYIKCCTAVSVKVRSLETQHTVIRQGLSRLGNTIIFMSSSLDVTSLNSNWWSHASSYNHIHTMETNEMSQMHGMYIFQHYVHILKQTSWKSQSGKVWLIWVQLDFTPLASKEIDTVKTIRTVGAKFTNCSTLQ